MKRRYRRCDDCTEYCISMFKSVGCSYLTKENFYVDLNLSKRKITIYIKFFYEINDQANV